MKLYIKYMMSDQCKLKVKEELEKLGLSIISIEIDEVEVTEVISNKLREEIKIALSDLNFELIDDTKGLLNGKIKKAIIEMVYHSDELLKTKNSDYISKKLNYDYTYLANLFSEINSIPIQQFILINKIERVKDLLLQGEFNLTEISYKLNYSSVSHLSDQFKKITGFTPSHFKKLNAGTPISIDGFKNSNPIASSLGLAM